MQKRRRFKQILTLSDRLTTWAEKVRIEAEGLPDGLERRSLLTKARQADIAARLDDWATSPDLKAQKA